MDDLALNRAAAPLPAEEALLHVRRAVPHDSALKHVQGYALDPL